MRYTQGEYRILSKIAIATQIYDYTVLCPEIAKIAQPGQFVHLLPKGFPLRRPISICGIDVEKGTLRFVFEVRGEGTAELARLNSGDLIDMAAPLGRGFRVNENAKRVILVGGGIGTPPMVPLAEIYGERAVAISGFRCSSMVMLQEDFKELGARTILCTNDGSMGIKGFVTVPLLDEIKAEKPDVIFACGPMPMLKAVAEIAMENDIECQVSLEERMGCGVGACLVCSCKAMRNGEEIHAHVCQDGPVFNAKEVIW